MESLDRLSRQRPRLALATFLEILDAGINIATLIDNRIYTPDSVDDTDLFVSIVHMMRAHDESLHKSDRLSAVWSNKRSSAKTTIITAKCKAWLRPRRDRSAFEPIPERAKVIERIFEEAAVYDRGADSIARHLNQDRVPTFGGATGWHKSYVLKILRDRSVIGEYQSHTVKRGVRKPEGPVLTGYYPRIVDDDLFYRAQSTLSRRRIRGGGRKGPRISNIFSKLAFCALCGSRMAFINKGRKGGTYLVCDAARRGIGCHKITWSYQDFERSFLTFVKDVDLTTLAGTADGGERNDLRSAITAIEGRLGDARSARDRIFSLMVSPQATDYLATKFREYDTTVNSLEANLKSLFECEKRLNADSAAFSDSRAQVAALIEKMQTGETAEMSRLRLLATARMTDLISEILVWPGGKPASSEARDMFSKYLADTYGANAPDIDQYMPPLSKDRRAFFVRFKNGAFTFVSPKLADPHRANGFANSNGVFLMGEETEILTV